MKPNQLFILIDSLRSDRFYGGKTVIFSAFINYQKITSDAS